MWVDVRGRTSWPERVQGRLQATFSRTTREHEAPATSGTGPPSDEEIRKQLDEIVNSPLFETSARNRRFLQYIVNETLAGHASRIKAYSVATMVFQRDANFDPQTDPIIRIEASRLRRALDHYYLGAGRSAPVRISVPKGSYVPTFAYAQGEPNTVQAPRDDGSSLSLAETLRGPVRLLRRTGAAMALAMVAAGVMAYYFTVPEELAPPPDKPIFSSLSVEREIPITVAPFQLENAPPIGAALTGDALARQIAGELVPFRRLRVLVANDRRPDLELGYLLEGGGTYFKDELRLWARLIKRDEQVWSSKFNIGAGPNTGNVDEVIGRIARTVAGGNGAILAQEMREMTTVPLEHATPRQCVTFFDAHQKGARQLPPALLAKVKDCLERAVTIDPGYAAAHAALAIAKIEQIRWRALARTEWPPILDSALTSAKRALELAPGSPLGFHALHHVQWLNGEVEQSIALAERAYALNPNDPQLKADLGFRYGMRAEWARAVPLLQQAYAEDPELSTIYRSMLMLEHYTAGRYEQALAEARKIDLADFSYTYVLLAISYAKLDLRDQASASVRQALALEPRLAERVRADLLARNIHPDVVAAIVDGLEAAGLQIPGRR